MTSGKGAMRHPDPEDFWPEGYEPSIDAEDVWTFTSEPIDFAPIWSQEDFEKRALALGWTPPAPNSDEGQVTPPT